MACHTPRFVFVRCPSDRDPAPSASLEARGRGHGLRANEKCDLSQARRFFRLVGAVIAADQCVGSAETRSGFARKGRDRRIRSYFRSMGYERVICVVSFIGLGAWAILGSLGSPFAGLQVVLTVVGLGLLALALAFMGRLGSVDRPWLRQPLRGLIGAAYVGIGMWMYSRIGALYAEALGDYDPAGKLWSVGQRHERLRPDRRPQQLARLLGRRGPSVRRRHPSSLPVRRSRRAHGDGLLPTAFLSIGYRPTQLLPPAHGRCSHGRGGTGVCGVKPSSYFVGRSR